MNRILKIDILGITGTSYNMPTELFKNYKE